MARISVVGAGYVGLVSACCYAEKGHPVIIREVDSARREVIQQGKAPFHEPSLDQSLIRGLSSGSLKVTDSMDEAMKSSDVTFIAVGTPSKKDGSIDLRQVRCAAEEVGIALSGKNGYHHVVVRSTVVPGTTDRIVKPILEETSGKCVGQGFGLAVNPEFLREGSAIEDTFGPDRILIGELDRRTADFLEDFYVKFHDGKPPPILRMSPSSAEMVKYASNTFLAMKISFINEIANICEKVPGVDVVRVAEGIGLDTRIGRKFLNAGLGFGGSCFPKDVRALLAESERLGCETRLIRATLQTNEAQALRAVELALDELRSLKGRQVAVLGLSFKPECDDMREARSLVVIDKLLKMAAEVIAYDPVACENARRILHRKIKYAQSARECIEGAECCIIVTEWEEFRRLGPEDFLSLMRKPVVIDGRRIYDPSAFAEKLRYRAIGLARN